MLVVFTSSASFLKLVCMKLHYQYKRKLLLHIFFSYPLIMFLYHNNLFDILVYKETGGNPGVINPFLGRTLIRDCLRTPLERASRVSCF